MRRRTFLIGAAGAMGAAASVGASVLMNRFIGAAPRLAKRQKLKMPYLIDANKDGKVALAAMAGTFDFGTGVASQTLGYNGAYLGPAIRLAPNAEVPVTVENHLDELTTLHWHGLSIEGAYDGGPHQPIAPGGVWSTHIATRQAAALAWYHSHAHGRTAPQVHSGLAGVLLIDDGGDKDFGIPNSYGEDEFVLVLQDKRFDAFGRMRYDPSDDDALLGFRGDTIAVNGQIDPYLDVPPGLVRLRLLNASNARFFTFSFADGRPLTLIGTDAGRLAAPLPLDSLRMAPAERCDILVDFSNGSAVTLWSRPDSNSGMSLGPLREIKNTLNTGHFRSFPVLDFRPSSTMKSSFARIPSRLNPAPAQIDRPVSQTRHFTLDMSGGESGMEGMTMKVRMTINGQLLDMSRSDFRVALGSSERWIVSTVMMAHPFHVHGCRFKVISEDGAPPRSENSGWKDVVVVEKQVELIAEFDNPANDANPYMYHCHILEHEDAGMMGQFSVGGA